MPWRRVSFIVVVGCFFAATGSEQECSSVARAEPHKQATRRAFTFRRNMNVPSRFLSPSHFTTSAEPSSAAHNIVLHRQDMK
jgi:hypothetical protein